MFNKNITWMFGNSKRAKLLRKRMIKIGIFLLCLILDFKTIYKVHKFLYYSSLNNIKYFIDLVIIAFTIYCGVKLYYFVKSKIL